MSAASGGVATGGGVSADVLAARQCWSRKASTEPHSTNQAAPATRRPAGGSFHREFHAPAGLAGDKADIPAVARPDKESEPVGLTARTPADQPDLGSASLSTFQAKIDAITAALARV
jgi:hypothetical protein